MTTVNDRLRLFLKSITGTDAGTVNDLQNRFYKGVVQGGTTPDPNTAEINKLKTDVGSLQTAVSNIPNPPAPSNTTPASVAVNGLQGTSTTYARSDHTHAARVQRKIVTLDANGLATWTFTRPFTTMPSLQYMVFQASGEPIIVEAQSWVMSGSDYVGVNIKAYRSRAMPTLTPLTVVTFVLTGVNQLFALLSGYNVFGGGSLNGVNVHLSAGDQM